ncbi:hypothetical protein [Mycobacterium mantenii]|uniref:hypothetical protein n=1 Tax=Mycobacterium mantenii TaxID=560555 RepID=UPI001E409C9A|nr:hypothetical protein [Mycobacterium mantenii]
MRPADPGRPFPHDQRWPSPSNPAPLSQPGFTRRSRYVAEPRRDRLRRYRQRAIEAVGYGTPGGPWLDVGVAVHAGVAYVGNVGEAVVDEMTAHMHGAR